MGDSPSILRRQFVKESRRRRGRPRPVDAAIGGEIEFGAFACAGDADMGEAAFFLKTGAALVVERAQMR